LHFIVRLPSEQEWQLAAQGSNSQTKYPWGSEWIATNANTYESGLAKTTAVGIYPHGASSVGAMDMIGNVWEWCANPYNSSTDTHNEPGDGIGNDNILANKVLRGGCWRSVHDVASTNFRNSEHPVYSNGLIGFRICASSTTVNHV